jgi:hypothetical protein
LGKNFGEFWAKILASFGQQFGRVLGKNFGEFWAKILASFGQTRQVTLHETWANVAKRSTRHAKPIWSH